MFRLSPILLLLPAVVWAAPPVAPPSAGVVQETLRPPRVGAPVVPGPAVATPDPARPPVPKGGARVRVNRFSIHGNESIADEELAALAAKWEGRDLTLEEIYGVSDLLTAHYHAKGYPLAIVTVPAQKVRGGTIRLEVIEGRVDRLLFEGNERYEEGFLARQLDRITPGTVLHFEALERELLLLDDLPGITARSVIQPGEKYGTSDIVFTVEETPWEGSVTFDNHGTQAVGEWRIGAALRWNNPARRGDVVDFGYTRTEQGLLDNLSLGYDTLVGNDGTRVGASLALADYQVGWLFQPLDIAGETATARLHLRHPWWRGRGRNLSLGLALSHQEAESTALGVPVSDTELTLLEATLDSSFIYGGEMVSTLSATLAGNFRENDSGLRNNRQRLNVTVDASHERLVAEDWALYLRALLAWSPDPLTDTQKFSIGGPDSVRGYVTAAERGDRGVLLTGELRRRLKIGDRVDATFRLFADYGAVSRLVVSPGEAKEAHLSAVGLGLLLDWDGDVNLDIQWANPTARRATEESRVWARLTAAF